ncbi:TetR/AcrR family transcriptional regulator [Herbiconiux sp. CPCC 205716]|uniref:TetR/AcrR family transcriptional regulator n=1 Tax=Herbiconiux gentiana TaxID=2970912 RepID=A0ABT2GET1_9MICO|nr:TetR/AcrR family transcriptional regulator [Herbiconiux gentiana]MCS5714698.1 TetR/AcrR family transcriptional regulator [Herbiconiux gentiana]
MTLTAKAEQTRGSILATGEELMLAKGFTGVGLQEILTTCGVPKGSFYHYFSSKEGFGVAVLDRYVENYLAAVGALLARAGTGRERIRMLGDAWAARVGSASAGRCLVVQLSAEVSGFSERMRVALADGVDALLELLADVVTEGQADGSIATEAPPRELAEAIYQLWLGAALLDRLARDGSPFVAALAGTDRLLDHP